MDKIRDVFDNVVDFITDFIDSLKGDNKKLILTIVAAALAILFIAGKIRTEVEKKEAAKRAENEELVLTPLVEGEEPDNNTFYIQTEGNIYKTCLGTSNFESIAKEADNTRLKWYTNDDALIPTVYKDDLILFYTKEALPTGFTWERFEDLGYTIGVGVLNSNDAGKYQFQIQKKENLNKYVNKNSSASQYFTNEEEGAAYVIDRVDTVKVSSDNVSNGGTIGGLTLGKTYTVDLYEGTNYTPAEIVADTHAFCSYEIYETVKYGYLQEGYVSISVPDNLVSGYYTINNGGLFRYVDNIREEGISGIDFNKAYYLGVADDGTIITIDNKQDYMSKEDLSETNDCYRYSLYLDSTTKQMDVDVTFNDTINFIENADADNPISAALVSPGGEYHELAESERKDNTFTTSVIGPEVGYWKLKVYNTGDKYFEVSQVLTSNQADYVNQTGTSKATMSVSLESGYTDGIFTFTWENTEHAAEILIKAPDGTKYGKSVNSDDVISESYGRISISVPNAKAGEYTIDINGEDLGKVRFYNDSVNTSNNDDIAANTKDIEGTAGNITTEEETTNNE